MKATYLWLTYSCLIFKTGILCDKKLEKRQAGSSCLGSAKDSFSCSDGTCILWSSVCDGRNDCSNGSDENNELCARYEYGINNTKECGKVYFTDNPVPAMHTKKAPVGAAPWNVAIYEFHKYSSNYDFLCTGSIISSKLIVSAALYFWESESKPSKLLIKDNKYKVAIGKYDKNFTVIDNEFTQIMNVEIIYLNEDYAGDFKSLWSNDLAVIVLSNRISFNNVVTPVCIDWSGKYKVLNGTQGKIVAWGKMEKGEDETSLLESSFIYIDLNSCRNLYTDSNGYNIYSDEYWTNDKFCASYAFGHGVNSFHHGSGLTIVHSNNSHFLTGIFNDENHIRGQIKIGFFIDIQYHINWLRHLYIKYLNRDVPFCVLPVAEGVIYSYEGSNKILAHGTLINQYRTVIENCDVGYYKTYHKSFRICQGNGKWTSNSEKLCLKMCPPLLSDSLDIKCTLNGKFSNCSNPSIPDTIALPSCKLTYIAPTGLEDTPFELFCQSNGMWNNKLYKCNPYCGKVYTDGKILIANGKKANVGTAPWNVGIYRLNKANLNYDLICGGTIISSNIVVTAAHCFWYKGILSNKISINDDSYKVAIGKYDRNFTVVDNDFTRIMNVEIIYLNEDYNGVYGFHANDIAVIVLPNRVSFSGAVAPICMDWNSKYNVPNGIEGKIVGWGVTENGTLSPVLLETSLPYIDNNFCRDMYTDGFQRFVTVDKFCAGSALVPGQGMGEGDSGAGLTYLHSTSYYLTGVLSLKQPSSNNSIAVFTNIKRHVQWIRELYNKHN